MFDRLHLLYIRLLNVIKKWIYFPSLTAHILMLIKSRALRIISGYMLVGSLTAPADQKHLFYLYRTTTLLDHGAVKKDT